MTAPYNDHDYWARRITYDDSDIIRVAHEPEGGDPVFFDIPVEFFVKMVASFTREPGLRKRVVEKLLPLTKADVA